MNRKQLLSMALVLCVIAGISPSHGQTSITIGAHYWYAMVDYKAAEDWGFTYDPGNMFGPYLNLRFGKLVLGSSMFFGNFASKIDGFYDFGYLDGQNYYDEYYIEFFDLSSTVQRTDLNFSLGYSLARFFNIFGAYKIQKNVFKEASANYDMYQWNGSAYAYLESGTENLTDNDLEDWNWDVSFYGGGASVLVPFGPTSPLFLFGSGAYLKAIDETVDGVDIDYADIMAVTAGIGFHTRSGLSLMAGYRADIKLGAEEGDESKTHGFMATAAYTIR